MKKVHDRDTVFFERDYRDKNGNQIDVSDFSISIEVVGSVDPFNKQGRVNEKYPMYNKKLIKFKNKK